MLVKQKDGSYRSKDGRFTVRRTGYMGSNRKYSIEDTHSDRADFGHRYLARTLEDCKEMIREIREDEEEDRD